MVVIDHQPSGWFLVRDGDRLLLDVNCSHSAVSYAFLMELNETERHEYALRGNGFISQLAEEVQCSAPGVGGSASPYRDRNQHAQERTLVDEAILAWVKGHRGAL